MSKQKSPDREKAFEIYKNHNGKIELVEIAKRLQLPSGTIRGWKNKDAWEQKLNGTLRKNKERSKNKHGAPKGNKNAVGHGAPAENKNAEKHGFFSKYLPEETFAIVQEIEKKNTLDLLWENILIQSAAIIRAQRIMYVRDRDDETTTQIEYKNGTTISQKWEVQHAWDKQATFLSAQSRAMGEIRSMIKQYDELLKSGLATEEQKARIEVLKSKAGTHTTPDDFNHQIRALADLINNPVSDRVIEDD